MLAIYRTGKRDSDGAATLPQARSGELWATNEFVGVAGTVDTEAIRDVHGSDVDALAAAARCSLDELPDLEESSDVVELDAAVNE